MGLFTDIIKEIPHTAVLQEKIAAIEASYAASETENAILKDTLREKDAKIKKLEKQVEVFTHKPNLHEIEIQIVQLLAKHLQVSEPEIWNALSVPPAKAQHHLAELREHHYVTKKDTKPFASYMLTKEGLAFANENDLIH